ncbi:hypothetical protein CONPUDRAFT_149356 [Coniophora puteana RWD-64-598 SS2]|uniref:Uncharacterized protein n=1 Tax=Coniophora puteana (strain RWD-64-598) TaxID=741705 RepID=A0A5M3N844_CONPW|nr:uncharacterized protein CONPUDRAFT_149356 [Coniophora puteana RWD-64-598 SS2]EIW87327.1 hypothetical protein CONPUDRAFT_149356 [Coniophora puteana RWD-64-598 SS2]
MPPTAKEGRTPPLRHCNRFSEDSERDAHDLGKWAAIEHLEHPIVQPLLSFLAASPDTAFRCPKTPP